MPDHPPSIACLERFSEPTRRWFTGAFREPTAAQEGAWNAIADGHHTLVVAPTGSGKTLSAFLWSIDRLMAQQQAGNGTKVLYISPLKALGVDVQRNLRSPLIGITQTARAMGLEPPELSTGVRSGDTPQAIRRALIASPPDILITTPESLYLMLTSKARRALQHIETVVIDEIHAVAGTKRGAHLAVSLERLNDLLDQPVQRIGLSATVEPVDTVTRFLGGRDPVAVVRPTSQKQWDVTVNVPVPDMTLLGGPGASSSLDSSPFGDAAVESEPGGVASIWPHVEERVVDLVEAHQSTIVFVNSRGLAEKLTARLNEIHAFRVEQAQEAKTADQEPSRQTGRYDGAAPVLARAHHGSVSKDQRTVVEESLKSGQLRCVVATSSLELGIDMGAVDLVVQIEAPPSAASGLQRVGRAGHQVGEVSVGRFFPKHRGDLLNTTVAVEHMLAGRVESLHILANPLDILAQHTVAACVVEPIMVEDWWDTVRRSAPFMGLPRSAFDAVLDLVSGRYPSDEFAQLSPRVVWDREEGTLTARPGAQRLAVTSGGTIPDRGLFPVHITGGADDKAPKRVGELDEEMVYESRAGDVVALGASSWRIEEITHDRVTVTPAPGLSGKLPFWHGDGLGRPVELGRAQGAFLREIAGADNNAVQQRLRNIGLDTWAVENLQAYVADMKENVGHVPSDRSVIIERFPDELGDWRVVLHSPFGMQVHAPWALAVSARIKQRWGLDGAAQAADDGIVLRIPAMGDDPPGAELFLFDPEELEQVVTEQVGSSALFASRFRECAARALLLPRRDPGRRTPLWQQRQRSAQLLDVARRYPQFPIVLEAARECLQDVYNLPALQEIHRDISQRTIRVVETTTQTPSAFAKTMLFGYVGQFIYEGDSPLAERQAAILSLDTDLLAELLGRAQLRELLDATVIERTEAELQYLAPGRRLRGREGLADALRLLGPLTIPQAASRLQPADSANDSVQASVEDVQSWAQELIRTHRAFTVLLSGEEQLVAVEDAARLRDAVGAPIPHGVPTAFIEPVADPVGDLVGRYARTHGPFTVAEAAASIGLGTAVVQAALKHLATERRVVEGEFRPPQVLSQEAATREIEWCDKDVLHRIRRRSLAALREQVEPVPPEVYARFLPPWQYVGPGATLSGADGVLTVVDQLGGMAFPASALEPLILSARVSDYSPDLLDELLASGEVLWSGAGSLSGDDGWVALHLAESQELTLPPWEKLKATAAEVTDTIQAALLEILADGAARFSHQLMTALGDRGHAVSASALETALWDAVWAGLITNDTFAPVRSMISGKSAHKQKTRTPVARSAGRRGAARLRPRHPGMRAAVGRASTSTQSGGRWSLLTPQDLEATVRATAEAELLLDRYGVLTRGAVEAENLPGGFASMYRVLTAVEDAGHTRRGYFIEGLGAAQFAQSSTVDRLRSFADDEQARTAPCQPVVLALAATDPANPWGATLPWPPVVKTTDTARHRPGRKAGAVVVSVDGTAVLYVERGGRTMLVFQDDPALIRLCAPALVDLVQRGAAEKFTVEKINGRAVLGSGDLEGTVRDALMTSGFSTTPKGLRLRRGV